MIVSRRAPGAIRCWDAPERLAGLFVVVLMAAVVLRASRGTGGPSASSRVLACEDNDVLAVFDLDTHKAMAHLPMAKGADRCSLFAPRDVGRRAMRGGKHSSVVQCA